jgi:hypothetical protein
MSGDTVAFYDNFVHWGGQQTVFGFMQTGPNGKIYCTPGGCDLMHVINYPDLPGTACDVVQRAFQLPTWSCGSMAYYPNYRLYDAPGSPCDTLGINAPVGTAEWPQWLLTKGLVYPNPASEITTLYLQGWEGEGQVQVTDTQGHLVWAQPVSRDRTSFPVAGWASGVYYLTVWKAGRPYAAEKIVVGHN